MAMALRAHVGYGCMAMALMAHVGYVCMAMAHRAHVGGELGITGVCICV